MLAKNGSEGLDLFKRSHEQIKLVFTDFEMPVMNGKDMAQQIRQLEQGKHVPIVGLTGHDSLEAQATGLAAGMTRVLVKPPTMADLKKVLKDYLFQSNSMSG